MKTTIETLTKTLDSGTVGTVAVTVNITDDLDKPLLSDTKAYSVNFDRQGQDEDIASVLAKEIRVMQDKAATMIKILDNVNLANVETLLSAKVALANAKDADLIKG